MNLEMQVSQLFTLLLLIGRNGGNLKNLKEEPVIQQCKIYSVSRFSYISFVRSKLL